MSYNIKEMDQTHWVCYQFQSKDYYYGQVAYLDEHGQIHPKDTIQMASNPKAKLVKHGFGIYIYNSKPQHANNATRYQGHWQKDKKNGQGILKLPDGSTYQGQFKQGLYHENGKFVWSNGCNYDGQWKRGRMDGSGSFKHYQGFNLKGSFKSNYFIDENILRNPFFSEKEYIVFKKQRKQTLKQKQRNQKVKHSFVQKINCQKGQLILQWIKKSSNNNRVPLVVSSQKSNFTIKNLIKLIEEHGYKSNNVDLRKGYVLQGEEKYNYKKQISKMVQNTLANNQALIINLDDSDVQYEELFYPDIRQFYDTQGMNPQIWSRSQTSRPQVYKKIIGQNPLSQNYILLVWSKVKLNPDLQKSKILEKLEKQFQSVIPIIKIDYIYLGNENHQSQE